MKRRGLIVGLASLPIFGGWAQDDSDPPVQADFFAETVVGGAAGPGLQSLNIDFAAYGLLIDNLTNQWLYEDARRRFIPPYQSGVTIALNGTRADSIIFKAPAGQTLSLPIAGEYFTATYLQASVPSGNGAPMGGNRGNYYDRNMTPVAIYLGVSSGLSGGGSYTSKVGGLPDYQVPAGREAIVKSIAMRLTRTAVATTPGVTILHPVFHRTTSDPGFQLNASGPRAEGIAANNVLGFSTSTSVQTELPMKAGAWLEVVASSADDATGQWILWTDMYAFEYDA